MRTPLTILRGYLELLLSKSPALPQREWEHLQMCLKTAGRMEASVSDIVAMLELDHGSLRLRPVAIDLAELAREVLLELGSFLETRGQARLVHAEPGVQPVLADPERLRTVLVNLITNAMKFTPDGGRITVRVSAKARWAGLTVEDDGVGIHSEELERVWDRFYVGVDPDHHMSSRHKFLGRGAGLGLAIVKGYVEAHGGRVWAESPGPRRGSSFHVELPVT
jgi:signal transduction histidine kinase